MVKIFTEESWKIQGNEFWAIIINQSTHFLRY